jgi:alanine racemase
MRKILALSNNRSQFDRQFRSSLRKFRGNEGLEMDSRILAYPMRTTTTTQAATGYLTIDLEALGRNYDRLSAMLSPARAAAVVKADAYGLGADRVANTVYGRGCRHFFVAQFVEALTLRPALARDAQIFVLNGLQPGNEIACAEGGIIPVLNSLEQWRQWSEAARGLKRTLPAVLQFDTGMSRLGIPPEERPALAAALKNGGNVEVLFIMSHLASADDLDAEQNGDQLAEMARIADEFAGYDVCLANSGGIFLGGAYHGVLARAGIALYGGAPTRGEKNPMEPVVSLDVAVIQTRMSRAMPHVWRRLPPAMPMDFPAA